VLSRSAFLKEDLLNREKKGKYGRHSFIAIFIDKSIMQTYFHCSFVRLLLPVLGLRFVIRRAYNLLNSIFQFDCMHIIDAFLHPNEKALKSVAQAQIDECHRTCQKMTVSAADELIGDENLDEPQQKKRKLFCAIVNGSQYQ
jgi:hypothetical protein